MPDALAPFLQLLTPPEAQRLLAGRARELRVGMGWKQSTLAARAGVTLATLRRFEQTGEVSLKYLARIAHALGRLDEFDPLLRPPEAASIGELERRAAPAETQAGVAMKKLTVRLRWSPREVIAVGQLADVDQRIVFEYDEEFLGRGLQLSPFKWALRPGMIEHVDRAFGPLPGVIDDSLPDGWGRMLMDRVFRQRGLDPAIVSPLDRLSWVGTRGMGALTYHPPGDVEAGEQLLDLHELGKNAQQVYDGESARVLPELIRAGGSPGGARPKVLVGIKGDRIISGEGDLPDGFEHWMIKFSAKSDVRNAGPIELAYSAMARLAGIEMLETRLFKVARNTSYFGVRRFDRGPGGRRVHVHTFGNLIHANFRIPSTDYADLLKVTVALTRNREDLLRAFSRMTFNIVAHNRDDHAKNFAFMMNPAGEWSLSPAYDLGFASGPGGEHTMTVMGEGKSPRREHVLRLGKQFDVREDDVVAIIDRTNAAVAKWERIADEAGCTRKMAKRIAGYIRSL